MDGLLKFRTYVVVAKAMAMAAVGWAVAAVLSIPQFAVYNVNVVGNKTVCESIFGHRPISHRQAYLTFINLVVFLIPFVIMLVCYCRIFTKISSKADQTVSILSTDEPKSESIPLSSVVRKFLAYFISREFYSDTMYLIVYSYKTVDKSQLHKISKSI